MRLWLSFGLALALAVTAGSVRAQSGRDEGVARPPDVVGGPPPRLVRRPSAIVQPSYTRLPTEDEMSEAYPEFANAHQIGGRVRLSCVATIRGRLEDCEVISATPGGLGFGPAALSLTPSIRTSPMLVDGVERHSRVNFNLVFKPEPDEAPIAWAGPEPSPEQVEALRPFARMMLAEVPLETIIDGVDADRREAVIRMQEDVGREFEQRLVDSLALALARIMTPEQVQAIVAGRPVPGGRPERERIESAGDDMVRVEIQYRDQVRDRYCALYQC